MGAGPERSFERREPFGSAASSPTGGSVHPILGRRRHHDGRPVAGWVARSAQGAPEPRGGAMRSAKAPTHPALHTRGGRHCCLLALPGELSLYDGEPTDSHQFVAETEEGHGYHAMLPTATSSGSAASDRKGVWPGSPPRIKACWIWVEASDPILSARDLALEEWRRSSPTSGTASHPRDSELRLRPSTGDRSFCAGGPDFAPPLPSRDQGGESSRSSCLSKHPRSCRR